MTRRRRVTYGLIAVAVVAVVVAAALRRNGHDEGIAVTLEPVARRTVVQTVTATGKIQPMTQVNVSADVSAKITRLAVDEGEWVEKGQLLLELERERYEAAVESAEANLRAAEAQANLARENMLKAGKDLVRSEQLFASNLESQATLDTVSAAAQVEKARHQAALDQVEQARATLRQARDDLAKTTIYAPMAGTVSRLNKEQGEIAVGSAFQTDVIMEISNLEGMEALVDVDENDVVLVTLGDRGTIEVDALPDARFAGEVTEIASSATISAQGTTDQRTEFEVKVAIAEPGNRLRPGMTASADIVTDTREACLSVPIQAVSVRTLAQLGAEPGAEAEARFTPDDEGFVEVVWVVSGGTAAARQVRTGIQSDTHIEILEGVDEGEEVVVGSYRAISRDLTDGAVVRLEAEGADRDRG